MKRRLILAFLLAAVWIRAPQVVHADTVTVDVAPSAVCPAHFKVYDVTKAYRKHGHRLQRKLAAKSAAALDQYVENQDLKEVSSFTVTSTDRSATVPAQKGQALLVKQEVKPKANALATTVRAAPVVVPVEKAPSTVAIDPKTVQETRVIYFFKYSDLGKYSAPLAGAVFAITRVSGGQLQYLSTDGTFIKSRHPLTDRAVYRQTSTKSGLVMIRNVTLVAGDYQVRELRAPAGYSITKASQHLLLHVPKHGAITLRGRPLQELVFDGMPADQAKRKDLRVLNPLTPPKAGGDLPQTGAVKTSLALLGLCIMALTLGYWRKTTKQSSNN